MPLYMDIHKIDGLTPEALAEAHAADMARQDEHGVEYLKYWHNEPSCKVFCLVRAPNPEAAAAVHREAHGFVAEKIIEVDPDLADGFLGGGEINPAGAVLLPDGPSAQRDPGVRSVMFTDIVGSTELTQRLGDEGAMAVLEVHDMVVREALAAFGGREVKHTGDGVMAAFVSAASAVRSAIQIQRALEGRFRERSVQPVSLRIGASAGEPVEQRQDLFGSTVQLAARLCSHAQPGQIVVSNVVAELCLGKGLRFEDLGEATFKGFDRPVRVHAALLE